MIKVIETEYKGYRFRSRLEARWAVFFDECGFKWEYEPEGFDVDGVKYLPDFRLHNVDGRCGYVGDGVLYVEVKGVMDADSRAKINAFAIPIPVYIVGDIPFGEDIYDYFHKISDMSAENDVGYGYEFFSYSYADGDNYPAGLFVNKHGHPELVGPDHDLDNVDWEKTKRALIKARQARFEHGECG
jgi:hypothetical protein